MRFVSVRDLRSRSAELWRTLPQEGEVIVTSNGRPVGILATVDESSVEKALSAFRRTRAVDAVASLQLQATRSSAGTLGAGDIEAEIRAVRDLRRR